MWNRFDRSAAPYEGWSVNCYPVRSTVLAPCTVICMEDYALGPREAASASGCRPRLDWRLQRDLASGYLADAKRGRHLLRFRGLQELLEVAVFGEDIGERLLDDIVGTSVDERRHTDRPAEQWYR